MARVVLQLINDLGEVEEETSLREGVTLDDAESVFAEVAGVNHVPSCCPELVIEFHYRDGDVGAHPDARVRKLWREFGKDHEPSHVVIRPDTSEGQLLSNRLHGSLKMERTLNALVATVNVTGGVVRDSAGLTPVADEDWLDLGLVYADACETLGLSPLISEDRLPGD